jgi:adenine-specific DNA-methyltransferase
MDSNHHTLGQYFTTNAILKKRVSDLILNQPERILEPSVGQGDLIEIIQQNHKGIQFDMYEIDPNISLLEGIPDNVIYGDFMKQNIVKFYKTIVGNPPYVRTKHGNLYIDFTRKCYELLESDGELIFVVPSDFFKLTCASKLLDTMLRNGTFTHIYHPHDEHLFENASIDVIVFRYCKSNLLEKEVLYNETNLYICNSNGCVTFHDHAKSSTIVFQNYFDVYVGLVSGKESVFKNSLGNMKILNGEGIENPYIYIEEYPCANEQINSYLLSHKNDLIQRKIRKFNEKNWFEWGAPRNISTMKKNLGKDCIYLCGLTRKKKVAFRGKVTYFGGNLLMLLPKEKIDLDSIVAYINSDSFKQNFMFSGRFKIGHRQISNSHIPFS